MWAVVPVKELGDAKRRLAGYLSVEEREELVLAMLGDVLEALSRSDLTGTMVVTRDPRIAELARDFGAEVMEVSVRGLNAALRQASAALAGRDARGVIALPCDLPCLDPDDVAEIVGAFEGVFRGVAVVADRHGVGTNGLAMVPPGTIEFCFGEKSFSRHRSAARAAGCEIPTPDLDRMRFDVDTADDLEAALCWPLGPRTRRVLESRLLGRNREAKVEVTA